MSEALSAGFKLIGRRPVSVLVWILFYLVLTAGVFALAIDRLGEDFLAVFAQALRSPDTLDPASLMPLLVKWLQTALIILPISMVGRAILTAGILRAEMRPEDKAFAYLRFGMDELRQILLGVVLFILFVLAAGLILGMLSIPALVNAPSALRGLVVGLGSIAFLVLLLLGVVRLGMAIPMTFARRRLSLAAAWKLTRGHAWNLLLLGFLLVLTIFGCTIGLSMITSIPTYGLQMELMAKIGSGEQAAAYLARPIADIVNDLKPIMIASVITGAITNILLLVIWVVPWASAYRQITERSDPAPASE